MVPRWQGIPVEAAPLLVAELTAILTLLLKRWRLAYRSELPLPSMAAPILLVVLRQAAADHLVKAAARTLSFARRQKLEEQLDTLERASGTEARHVEGGGGGGNDGGGDDDLMGMTEVRACRSDVVNATAAIVTHLCPALAAGKPWGSATNGTASGPPNQPLLLQIWLQLQWLSPALLMHLQRGTGVSAQLMRLALSHLATAASAAAFCRLVDVALWDTAAAEPCRGCHLLVALLRQNEPELLAVSPTLLGGAIGGLRVETALDAQRLHESAVAIAAASPRLLREVSSLVPL